MKNNQAENVIETKVWCKLSNAFLSSKRRMLQTQRQCRASLQKIRGNTPLELDVFKRRTYES